MVFVTENICGLMYKRRHLMQDKFCYDYDIYTINNAMIFLQDALQWKYIIVDTNFRGFWPILPFRGLLNS